MFKARVEIAVFTDKIQEYQRLTQKAMGEVVVEQSRLLADRLTKLTYPFSAAQGRKRVAIDIGKVYLGNKWFEETFQFKNQALGERVKSAVRTKDSRTLATVFQRSPKLSQIRLEPFSRERHKNLRRNGRVLVPDPRSFPVSQQGEVNKLVKEKQKNVGLAKAGWAVCSAQLGKTVPGWLNKAGAGSVTNNSRDTAKPFVVLSNRVAFFAAIDAKSNVVSRALAGRGRDMVRSAEKQLADAARKAKLN